MGLHAEKSGFLANSEDYMQQNKLGPSLGKLQIQLNCETSLLLRLQAQTLPDATPPIGKIHPFSKIAVTLNEHGNFDALQDLESLAKVQYSFF